MPEIAGVLRLSVFLAVLAAMLVLETVIPRRAAPERRQRWTANLGIAVTGALLVRLLVPAAATGAALFAASRGIGLFNSIALPALVLFPLSILLLDFTIWAQHLAFHKVPLLWRMHRMHHADPALDATTGIRFHPLEILISMLIKIGIVMALGVPALAVMIFEIALNATAMFNHANIALPRGLDRLLRKFLVTPDFHLVHHSVIRAEHDANYGFNLSWWDYLFGTYIAEPRDGRDGMQIGLADCPGPVGPGFLAMLKLPFAKEADH